MKRATFTILFFIKRSKLLKTGEAPVYLRITSNGDSSEISIKRSIKLEKPLMLTTQKRIKVTTRKRSMLTTQKRIMLTT